MHVKAPGFPRHPEDDELVNNFMSGFSLADAIKAELAEHGYERTELIGEDYGWLVVANHRPSGVEFSVTLSSLAEPDCDENVVVEAIIAIQPQKRTKGWLWWRKDIGSEVREFSETVFNFLRNTPGVHILEEFADIA